MNRLFRPLGEPTPGREAGPSVTGIVGQAFLLLRDKPKETMLPMLAVQAPLSIAIAGITLALYLTVFREQPIDPLHRLVTEEPRGQQFMAYALGATRGLFSLVAFGATVVSVAAVLRGRAMTLPEALDPAFARMGGLIGVALITVAATTPMALPPVGLLVAGYVIVRFGMMLPVLMLEGSKPGAAMRRSWALMCRGRMALLRLIMVTAGLVAIPWLGMALGTELVGEGRTAGIIARVLLDLGNGMLLAPMLSFAMAALTLFYLEVSSREAAGSA